MPKDEYEDYEEKFHTPGKSGDKKKSRNSNSKTSKKARSSDVQNAQYNRKQEAKDKLAKLVSEFEQKEDIEKYIKWLNTSLDSGVALLDNELDEEFTRSGGKGGQNVNKVSTAVHLTHTPTKIHVRSEVERTQGRNREEARKVLTHKLGEHVKDWETYLDGTKTIDQTYLTEILS